MANGTAAKAASRPKREGIFSRIGKAFASVGRFIRESYVETWHKSSWPTWKELRQFTTVVIFAVAVVSVWIGGLDFILGKITERIAGGKLVR
ncbi:MAG: preprotein translocase subunit SecE [Armatimonadetes bacterium]|nr:preprotein translocase subunit SecE [Armatimonadota bacterium]